MNNNNNNNDKCNDNKYNNKYNNVEREDTDKSNLDVYVYFVLEALLTQ